MADNSNEFGGDDLNPSPDAVPRAPRKKRGLPEWAQIQSDISEDSEDNSFDVEPSSNSPFGKSQKPSAPVQPSTSVPTPTPTVAVPVAQPAVPETKTGKPARPSSPKPTSVPTPTPTVAVPVAQPTEVKPPTPVEQPLLKPTVVPEYSEKPGFPQANIQGNVEQPAVKAEETYNYQIPKVEEPLPEPKSTKQRFKKNPIGTLDLEGRSTGNSADWEPTLSKRQERKRKNAGGRWKILAIRYSVFGVMGLIVLLGFAKLVSPIPVADIASQVQLSLGYNGFPIAKGQQLAARFAVTYLNYDEATRAQREAQLLSYLSPNASGDFAKTYTDIPGYSQTVIDGPYLVGMPDLVDSKRVAYTYTALVANMFTGTKDANGSIIAPQWVYLEIPAGADDKKNVAIVGAPAFVPAPEKAGKIDDLPFAVDDKATESAKKTVVDYLSAWAASTPDAPVSSQYLRKGESTYAAQVGLGGKVIVSGNPSFAVEAIEKDSTETKRNAVVTVTWKTQEGLTYIQKYRMSLTYVDQYWYILDISGGNYSTY